MKHYKSHNPFDMSSSITPILTLPFQEGVPTPAKAKTMNRWIAENSDIYQNKFVVFYHGTHPNLPIEKEGLKPTSLNRRKSYQSKTGYVYLANTPERAERFGKLGNGGECVVYAVMIPIRELKADLDQLNNLRAASSVEIGNSVGESIVYGGGVRFAGAIEAWKIKKISLEDSNKPSNEYEDSFQAPTP